MEERIDIYNAQFQATGHTQLRSEELLEDAWYLLVNIWVRDREGRLLLTQRCEGKRFYPLRWESPCGFTQAGEGMFSAARRELEEETGLVPEQSLWRYLGKIPSVEIIDGHRYQSMVATYLVTLNESAPAVRCQPEEVKDYRWLTPEEYLAVPEEEQEPFTPLSFRQFRGEILVPPV